MQEGLKVGSQTTRISNKVRDVGLKYPSSYKFSEHAFAQAAMPIKIGLLHGPFRLNQGKLKLSKSHLDPSQIIVPQSASA